MEIFYKEVEEKRKGQKTRLQTDQEFKEKKIFEPNKKYSVDVFNNGERWKSICCRAKIERIKKGFRKKNQKKIREQIPIT